MAVMYHSGPQLALQDEAHAVSAITLVHDRRPLRHLMHFHVPGQMVELCVIHPGQNPDAPQGAGSDAHSQRRVGSGRHAGSL